MSKAKRVAASKKAARTRKRNAAAKKSVGTRVKTGGHTKKNQRAEGPLRFELADIVATVLSLTNWSVDYILNKLSYPQLLLIMDRYPAYELQPENDSLEKPSLKLLTEFGGKNGSTSD